MLDRIERLNPRMHAYIEIDRAGALAAALESDRRYAADEQRPLDGIAVGVKANIGVAGLELNAGMIARKGLIAEQDAAVITKIRDAGMIILGTLNMDEAALGAVGNNPFFGRCINPHGDGLTAGGSSGGSGSAVAAGLCTAALGTDTLGSVRIPASYCGVYGLKPTYGAISNEGIEPVCAALDTVGILTRSMDDISFLSNIVVAPELSSAMQRARFLTIEGLGGATLDGPVAEAYRFALSHLPLVPAEIRLDHDCGRIRLAGFATAARELAMHLVSLGEERCAQISERTAKLIDFALSRSDEDLTEDQAILAATGEQLRAEIGNNGILVLPTTPQTAFPASSKVPLNQADFTALANIAGLPAVSLPIGRSADLLPISMQLVGPASGEALLVAQARSVNDRLKAYAPPVDWW